MNLKPSRQIISLHKQIRTFNFPLKNVRSRNSSIFFINYHVTLMKTSIMMNDYATIIKTRRTNLLI